MFGSSRSAASLDKADDDPGVRRNAKGRALLDLHYDEYNTKIYPSGSVTLVYFSFLNYTKSFQLYCFYLLFF